MSVRSPMRGRWAKIAVPLVAAAFAAGGLGVAQATSAPAVGHGEMEYGQTVGFYKGSPVQFTYTKGFFCDTTVAATSATGCEVGQTFNRPPAPSYDPLYITVPLGFTVPPMKMDCPSGLKCVDHPATLDLTRLATALAPVFKTTPALLLPALRDFVTPGHDHFLTTLNNGQPEWWDVQVVGVTSKAVYDDIHEHGSFSYIEKLISEKNPNVVGPIPTNLFLYFKSL
jgi:hypothetical protein